LSFYLFEDYSTKQNNEMQKGKIARLMDKGFGFIAIEGQDKDLFFHMNELQNTDFDSLKENDVVEFEVVDGEKGPSAVNVSIVTGDADATTDTDADAEVEAPAEA